MIGSLPPSRVLDVACGTGFLTSHLRGEVTGIDQSARMLEIARRRLTDARLVEGDALELPFSDASFDRVFSAHFYGHLRASGRAGFLAEAVRRRRVRFGDSVPEARCFPDEIDRYIVIDS